MEIHLQHWHQVMPGVILDVHYEETVTDLEGQVRRILDFCGLEFEQSCVDFHLSDRAVAVNAPYRDNTTAAAVRMIDS